MTIRVLVGRVLVAVAVGALAAAPSGWQSDLVVHEWGTFLSMNGSDGITLDGMYHEEHALPSFVHARSRELLKLPSSQVKSETPVIYFYAQRPERVVVTVNFPTGLWTQWFPQASLVGPDLVRTGSPPRPRNGQIVWNVGLVPPAVEQPALPATSADSLWNHAREVDAAYVSSNDMARPGQPREWERFIFYRGLGQTSLPLDVSVTDGDRIALRAELPQGVKHVYVMRVEKGLGAYRYIPAVAAGRGVESAAPAMEGALPVERFAEAIGDDLARRLVESGLYEKEARAMVNTWRGSYFTTDGLRVLFVLPQSWTDRYIPLKVSPEPKAIVRVMVGRVELLTPEREREIEAAISDLASPESSVRERAFATLRAQGRYVEPIVRRTLATSRDEQVLALCRRLLSTDFVTEIRATLGRLAPESASERATYLRAQLASLLRDVGLETEAKQEGEQALAELAKLPPPNLTRHESRHTFRALARAHEGAGDDAGALKWYGDFVEFGSRSPNGCAGCHGQEGPRDSSFFRDWWAGRRFGQLASRTGAHQGLVREQETMLTLNPQNRAAQLKLAYLYEARGDSARAARLWAQIDPAGEPATLSARTR